MRHTISTLSHFGTSSDRDRFFPIYDRFFPLTSHTV